MKTPTVWEHFAQQMGVQGRSYEVWAARMRLVGYLHSSMMRQFSSAERVHHRPASRASRQSSRVQRVVVGRPVSALALDRRVRSAVDSSLLLHQAAKMRSKVAKSAA
jgi:hypothetical protein